MLDLPIGLLKNLKIVVFVMAIAMLAFSAITVVVAMQRPGAPEDYVASILLMVLVAMAVIETVTFAILRHTVIGKVRRSCDESHPEDQRVAILGQGFASVTIIGAAMAEGLGLFGAVVTLTTGNMLGLIAPGVAILLLAALLPTREKVRRFTASVTGEFI